MLRAIVALPALLWSITLLPQSTPDAVANRGDVSLTDASASEVDRQVAAALAARERTRSGQWKLKTKSRIRMRRTLGISAYERRLAGNRPPFFMTRCVAKEDTGFFTGREPGDSPCHYDKFVLKGDTLDAVMWCPSENDRYVFTTHGDFSPNGFVVESDFVSAWGHKAHMKTMGTRVGDCRE